ncbi:peptidase C14 caspase catalytic subunit p20, partial [Aetokthonos hydrillicola CCALA 1050]|nr:peptidase C14 caspase catalytic subunit p20 [Aetokthonos hydrillicola CCALA 1050]
EEALLAIFPDNSSPEQLREFSNAICRARVTQVLPELSKVEIIGDKTHLSTEKAYFAVIISLPLPQLKVCFQGDPIGVELARQELSTCGYNNQNSLFVREVAQVSDANYYIEAEKNQYWIKKASDKSPLVTPVPEIPSLARDDYTPEFAHQVIQRLEHIARWQNILDLNTPLTSQIKLNDVEMEVIICSAEKTISSKQTTSEMRAEYTYNNGKWTAPTIQIKITNNSQKDLYFQVVELAGDYEVCIPPFFEETTSLFLPKKSQPGAILTSRKLSYVIPKSFLSRGITEYQEIFKLIVSTSEFDAGLLQQPGLDSPPPKSRSSGGLKGSLNHLMHNIYNRETTSSEDNTDTSNDNWMTKQVSLTLTRQDNVADAIDQAHNASCARV